MAAVADLPSTSPLSRLPSDQMASNGQYDGMHLAHPETRPMASIAVDVNDRARVLEAFYAWRRDEQGLDIVSLPAESAGPGNSVVFSQVPPEFLAILSREGIPHQVQ